MDIQKKSRDSRRKADLAAIQQALEVFYADNGFYPTESNKTSGAMSGRWADEMSCYEFNEDQDDANRVTWGTPFTCPNLGKTYMQKIPSDPAGDSFRYQYEPLEEDDGCQADGRLGSCQHYTLWATLENKNDPDIARTTDPDPVTNSEVCHDLLGTNQRSDGRPTFYRDGRHPGDGDTVDQRYLDNTNKINEIIGNDQMTAYYNGGLGEKFANYCVHDPRL